MKSKTIEMKKKMEDIPSKQRLLALMLINVFEREFGISKRHMLSETRKNRMPIYRAMCFNVLIKVEKMRPMYAAAIFGKDHSTANHGLKVHQEMYETDSQYKEEYEFFIEKYLYERDVRSLKSNSNTSIFDIISKIEETRETLSKIKEALILNTLKNVPISPEIIDIVNQNLSENDKRTIIEKTSTIEV